MTNPPCLAFALYHAGPSKAAQLSGPALPSAPMISVQTDCRWVPCLCPALQLQHQTSAVPRRLDRRSVRRRMCHSASLTWSGTLHLTSRACGRRVVKLAYLECYLSLQSNSGIGKIMGILHVWLVQAMSNLPSRWPFATCRFRKSYPDSKQSDGFSFSSARARFADSASACRVPPKKC